MLIKLIVELVLGGLSGCAASKIMGSESKNLLKNVLLGLGGGIVGGFLGNLIGLGDGWITGLILSIVGACLIIWLVRKFSK